jgi:hypothetical protein
MGVEIREKRKKLPEAKCSARTFWRKVSMFAKFGIQPRFARANALPAEPEMRQKEMWSW